MSEGVSVMTDTPSDIILVYRIVGILHLFNGAKFQG